MPLCKRLNLEDVKNGEKYETILQYHFSTLLGVQPEDITITLLQNDIITYVVRFTHILVLKIAANDFTGSLTDFFNGVAK